MKEIVIELRSSGASSFFVVVVFCFVKQKYSSPNRRYIRFLLLYLTIDYWRLLEIIEIIGKHNADINVFLLTNEKDVGLKCVQMEYFAYFCIMDYYLLLGDAHFVDKKA